MNSEKEFGHGGYDITKTWKKLRRETLHNL